MTVTHTVEGGDRGERGPVVIDLAALDALVGVVAARGFDVIGPTVRDGVIDYARVDGVADLPIGWIDEQRPAHYRAVRAPAPEPATWTFGYATAVRSPKSFFYPAHETVVHAVRSPSGELAIEPVMPSDRPLALVGVRSCEVHAVAIQDRVLRDGEHPDLAYAARRAGSVVIGVDCSHPAETCFCTSMGTGPSISTERPSPVDADAPDPGDIRGVVDVVLSELPPEAGRSACFVARAETEVGAELLALVASRDATDEDLDAVGAVAAHARTSMRRQVTVAGLHDRLLAAPEHPAWQATADRCIACTNCTMACPTCFCSSTVDTLDLSGADASRSREWDSCFSLSFSYIHGGSVRASTRSRYRQWATHKLASWIDQFDTAGCVGCGRCITWCPAGIDITELAREVQDGAAVAR